MRYGGNPYQSSNPKFISLDAAQFHKTTAVLTLLRSHDIVPSIIIGGCTGLIRPLDAPINGLIKIMLKDSLDTEMDRLGKATLSKLGVETENAMRDCRILMTKAVGEAWKKANA